MSSTFNLSFFFIHLLPDDVIRRIIPYTYQPQNEELLEEVRTKWDNIFADDDHHGLGSTISVTIPRHHGYTYKCYWTIHLPPIPNK